MSNNVFQVEISKFFVVENLFVFFFCSFLSGNLDFIVAYPLSENAYHHMRWSKIDLYKQSLRNPFFVNGTLAGYIRKADNFADVMILNAGHMQCSELV